MLNLIKRLIKGSKLTTEEVDNNWTAIEEAVNSKADTSHTHEIGAIQGLDELVNSKVSKADVGQANGIPYLDEDVKIPVAQIPSHQHSIDDITDWSVTNHTHPISQIEELQSALDSKINAIQKGAANGLATLDGSSKIPSVQLPTHNHAISEVTGLSAVLSGLAGDDIDANRVVKKYILQSGLSASVVTRVDVSGWSFNVVKDKIYQIEIIADYQTVATTTGGSMGVNLTSGTGTIKGYMQADITQTAAATGLKATIYTIDNTGISNGCSLTTSGVGAINTPHSWYAMIVFKCTSNGVFQIQWGSEVAGSAATLNADSIMIVTTL